MQYNTLEHSVRISFWKFIHSYILICKFDSWRNRPDLLKSIVGNPIRQSILAKCNCHFYSSFLPVGQLLSVNKIKNWEISFWIFDTQNLYLFEFNGCILHLVIAFRIWFETIFGSLKMFWNTLLNNACNLPYNLFKILQILQACSRYYYQ